MQIKDLKPNKRNPRKISEKKLSALKASVEKFGDLSGFVFNRRTKALVSGHQRSKVIPKDAKIKIEVKHDVPTAARTVAEGYVEIDGERFKYREVDADETWEMEALLAANKHGGEWDKDLLRLAIADIPGIDLEVAGFDIPELKAMNIEVKKMEIPAVSSPFEAEEEEAEAWEEKEETDEEYIENNPGPDSQVSKENIDMINRDAFSEIQEDTKSKLEKILVVIELETKEGRDELKKKLRTEEFNLAQYGAKMY